MQARSTKTHVDAASPPGRARWAPIAGLGLAAILVVGGGAWAVRSIVGGAGTPTTPSEEPALASVQSVLDAARAYLSHDKPGSAEAILRAAANKFPADQGVRLLYGECLMHLGKLDEAYAEYEQGIFIGPDHPEYRHAAGTIAAQIGRLDDAELHYRAAQQLQPTNPKFPLYLAQVQRRLGRVDEARASLALATKLDPSLAIAWASLAAIALDDNKLQMAQQYIARSRELEPERLEWRVVEAKILRRDNRPADAAALLSAVPEAERATDAGVLAELAASLGMLARAGEAAELYIKAFAAQPQQVEFAYQAAVWLDRAGQRGRAALYAQQAAAKGHSQAKELLARVEPQD